MCSLGEEIKKLEQVLFLVQKIPEKEFSSNFF